LDDDLWSVDASLDLVAGVFSAWVLVVAFDEIVLDDSGLCIAVVLGACISVASLLEGVDASLGCIASVGGAWVLVITINVSVDASLQNIARILGAFVSVTARNCFVLALSGFDVARVTGACVVVVTADVLDSALSSDSIASCSLAFSLSLACNWGEDAVSIVTSVNGAQVLVVTDLSGVDTSNLWIARSN
jgi:hypothetical protein